MCSSFGRNIHIFHNTQVILMKFIQHKVKMLIACHDLQIAGETNFTWSEGTLK